MRERDDVARARDSVRSCSSRVRTSQAGCKSACKPVDAGAGSHGDDSFGLAAASTWIPAAHTPAGPDVLSATIDNPSGTRVVMFNPVVANLPPSTVALRPLLLFVSHLLSFDSPFPPFPRLLPALLPPSSSSPPRRDGQRRPDHPTRSSTILIGQARSLVTNVERRYYALPVALVFLVLLAIAFEQRICCWELR